MEKTERLIENGIFTGPISKDCYFMSLAYLVSSRSKDPRTRCGSIAVFDDDSFVSGYNGTPGRGFNEHVLEGVEKHRFAVHSESNTLDHAGLERCRQQKNLRLYVLFHPCVQCALKIVHFNVKEVIYHSEYRSCVNDNRILDIIQHNGEGRGSLFRKRLFKIRKYRGPLLFSHKNFGIDKIPR